jgi:hypothetical protein
MLRVIGTHALVELPGLNFRNTIMDCSVKICSCHSICIDHYYSPSFSSYPECYRYRLLNSYPPRNGKLIYAVEMFVIINICTTG